MFCMALPTCTSGIPSIVDFAIVLSMFMLFVKFFVIVFWFFFSWSESGVLDTTLCDTFVSDLRLVDGFLWVLWFPNPNLCRFLILCLYMCCRRRTSDQRGGVLHPINRFNPALHFCACPKSCKTWISNVKLIVSFIGWPSQFKLSFHDRKLKCTLLFNTAVYCIPGSFTFISFLSNKMRIIVFQQNFYFGRVQDNPPY